MKRQATVWAKIFANHISDRWPVCRMCVCVCIYISQNLTVKKNKNLIRKWAKGIKRDVCKDDIQMANKHKKNWSIPLAIRKMPMKTTERYHYMCIRMTKTKIPSWKESKATKSLIHDWLGIQNGIVTSENIFVLY